MIRSCYMIYERLVRFRVFVSFKVTVIIIFGALQTCEKDQRSFMWDVYKIGF